jgi:hypothetical protein
MRSQAWTPLYFITLLLIVMEANGQAPPENWTANSPQRGNLLHQGNKIIGNDCNFTDLLTFFAHAHANNLNIAKEMEICQNLCILTFGAGNPDLSGVGVTYLSIQ